MRTQDKERKNMIGEVINVTNDPLNGYIALRSGLTSAIGVVKGNYLAGIAAEAAQGIATWGVTADLAKSFNLLCKSEFKMCSAGSAYFGSIPDLTNRAKVDFTLPQIEATHYNGIGAFCDGTLLTVTATIAALLGPYGGSVLQRTDVVNKLAAYRLLESSTDEAIDARKVQTSAIHPFMMEAIANLELLVDPIINTLLEDSPILYALYWNARKINHFPHGTTIAEGYMLDPLGHGILGGDVFFPLQNKTVVTHLDGSYSYPHFPHGIATPVASHPLFKPNTANPYEIKQGKTISHVFNMIPV